MTAQRGTSFHTDALAEGLAALEESRDFVPRRRPVGKPLEMARIVSGHTTPVLNGESLAGVSAMVAARRYYAFAQEKLAGAAAGEAASSIALYGLGRVAAATGDNSPSERMEAVAQAMVLYQAALLADRNNYRAANELGVILARKGDLLHARELFAHSARLSPHPAAYRNLAVVHSSLGEKDLAEQAMTQVASLEKAGLDRRGPAVQWVDPATFAGTAPTSNAVLPPVAKTTPATKPEATDVAPEATERKGFTAWLPWTTRR